VLLRTGKAGPLLKPAQYLRGLLPQSHETSRDLFHYFWPASGVSCIIKCPVTGVNPNLFCSLTRLRFGASAFVSPGFPFLRARPRGEPGRLRAERRGGYVQARTVGAITIGAERVAAYKEAYGARPEGLASRFTL
jgi:hypothetical protein